MEPGDDGRAGERELPLLLEPGTVVIKRDSS